MTNLGSTLLALVTLTLASPSVHASPVFTQARALLTEFRMDPHGSRSRPDSGSAEVDLVNHTVTLSLDMPVTCSQPVCPPGRHISRTTLPIISQKDDGCGSTIFIAEHDARPVDGVLRVFTVSDHSTRLCEDYRPFATEVTETITLPSRGIGSRTPLENYYGGGRLTPSRIHQ